MKLNVLLKENLGNMVKKFEEPADKRIYITIDRNNLLKCAEIIFKNLDARYVIASGIHNENNFEMLYHFSFDKDGVIVSLRVYLDKEKPEVESLVSLIPGIEYIERETWEFFGIKFLNNPNLKHFLLPEDWPEGDYPVRKK
ncbi:MAG: NADH-quinone oxidoreductase subunit C [Candidatus Omnitrophica bacterium]|nr:NADH-quinone oxidoreductase subunit C [Candidatus Omnitrophota bacterium]